MISEIAHDFTTNIFMISTLFTFSRIYMSTHFKDICNISLKEYIFKGIFG